MPPPFLDAWADRRAAEKKAQLCLLCHRVDATVGAPTLEQQPTKYLVVQTNAFKSGKMTDSVMRANVASLSATDIQDISDYFSSQRAKQAKFAIGRSKALSKVSKSTFSLRESKGELKEINKMAFRGKESFYLEAF